MTDETTDETTEVKPDLEVEDDLSIKEKLSTSLALHSKEVLSAVVIGVLVTIISTGILDGYFYQAENEPEFSKKQDITAYELVAQTQTQTHREYFVQANLAQVISVLSGVKMHLAQHFMMTGKMPVDDEEFDISSLDLDEYDQINRAFISEKGGIGVELSGDFGTERTLILRANPSSNNAFLKWKCETNVNPRYLGVGQGKMCEHNENL